MPTLPVSKAWLVDSFELMQYANADEYGGAQYRDAVLVTGCRIDYKPTYTRTADEVTRLGNAMIYCYAGYTSVDLATLTEKSQVKIQGKTYTVKEARRYHEVESGKPYSVELVIL